MLMVYDEMHDWVGLGLGGMEVGQHNDVGTGISRTNVFNVRAGRE